MKRLCANLIFYPTLAWNILLGRLLGLRRWWDEVDEHVVIGALPFESDVPGLVELGIKAVVNTCYEYEGPVAAYMRNDIEQLHVPTVDFSHPSLDSIESAVDFMEEQTGRGNRVYVHCKAGRARSATVVACWLIKHYQMSADEAQALLLKVRPHVNPGISQRAVVRQFEQKHLRNRKPQPKD